MFGVPVSRLAGYAPALPTPFDDRGRRRPRRLCRLCEMQINEGATALVVGDAAGEATSLDIAEFGDIVGNAARIARKRVPIFAGVASNATLKAAALAQRAEQCGADALVCGAPYYNKPTQEGVFSHFQWIAESIGLPIFLHDAPARTACPIADATLARLAALPQFIGLIDATGDMARVARLRTLTGLEFRLLSERRRKRAFVPGAGRRWLYLACVQYRAGTMPQYVSRPSPRADRARATAPRALAPLAAPCRETEIRRR